VSPFPVVISKNQKTSWKTVMVHMPHYFETGQNPEGRIIKPLFWASLAIYIAFLPISGTIAVRKIALFILLAITFWQVGHKSLKLRFPLWQAWLFYASVALGSLMYAVDRDYSLHEIMTEFAYPVAITMIGASWIRTIDRFNRLVWLLVAGNILFVTGIGWSLLHPDSVRDGLDVSYFGTGVGDVASYIVATLPLLLILTLQLYERGRVRLCASLGALIVGNLVAVFVSGTREAWISIAASLLVMAILAGRTVWTTRRLIFAALMIVFLFAAAAVQFQKRFLHSIGFDESVVINSMQIVARDPRLELWSFCLPRIAEHPLTGGGFGRAAFRLRYPEFYNAHTNEQFWHCHNMVINKGIQMGLPGIIAFLLLWLALMIEILKGLHLPSLKPWVIALLGMITAVFVRNMTDDFYLRDHLLLFWLLCGAFLGMLREARSTHIADINR
jgi:O-antigen ligase